MCKFNLLLAQLLDNFNIRPKDSRDANRGYLLGYKERLLLVLAEGYIVDMPTERLGAG